MAAKTVRTIAESAAVLLGVLALVLSFISAYISVSYDGDLEGFDLSTGVSAWHSYATLGMLLVVLALTIATIKLICGDTVSKPIGVGLLASAALFSLIGTAMIAIRAFTVDGGGSGIKIGLGWSGVLLLVVSAGLVLSLTAACVFASLGEGPSSDPARANASSAIAQSATYPLENSKALWSMILGIVSFACAAPITSIIAIVLATQAKREIAESGGQQGGESKAKAGLTLGIVTLALSLLGLLALITLLILGAAST